MLGEGERVVIGVAKGTFICGSILWIALRFGVCRLHACRDGVFKVCGLQRGQGRDLICDWWIGISKWACREFFGFGGGWGLGRGMREGGKEGGK